MSLVIGGVFGVPFLIQYFAERSREEFRLAVASSEVGQIRQLCDMYMLMKRGRCPGSVQDLESSGIPVFVRKDPWGEEYVIRCPGEHDSVDVTSTGPDRKSGGGDDIRSWEKPSP